MLGKAGRASARSWNLVPRKDEQSKRVGSGVWVLGPGKSRKAEKQKSKDSKFWEEFDVDLNAQWFSESTTVLCIISNLMG